MSVAARIRRLIGALVIVCIGVIGVVGQQVSANERPMDPKLERRLFLDYYHPGASGATLEKAIAKASGRKASAASQCGEYDCQWDWGTGIWVCFEDGEYAWLYPGQQARCTCYDGGDCYWEW